MRRTIIGIAAIVAALFFSGLPTSPASAGMTNCGRIRVNGIAYKVTIYRGHVSCHRARRLIKTYGEGGGRNVRPPGTGRSGWYSILPGRWRCSSGAGGALGCSHGPKVNRYEWRIMVFGTQLPFA